MNRLFVSLNLPDEVIDKIVQIRDSIYSDKNLKWEPKEKLHLTLKFIGDVPFNIVDEISKELVLVNKYTEFNCSFFKFGFFYRDDNPNILWAGLKTDNYLNDLVTELNQKLKRFSIPTEKRKFNAHITLLRIKKELGINFVNKFKNFTFEPIEFTANNIVLYKSILLNKGSKYFKINNYKLKRMEM